MGVPDHDASPQGHEKVFCEDLTIVIAYKDAAKHSIDITELGAFLSHICEYTEFSQNRAKLLKKGAGAGVGIS